MGVWSGRACFVLSSYGLKCHWLSCGLNGWQGQTESGESAQGCDESVELKWCGDQYVDFEQVQAIVKGEKQDVQIIDARDNASFQGGNIPGSLNCPVG